MAYLEQRVARQHSPLQGLTAGGQAGPGAGEVGEVAHDVAGRHGLAGPGLAGDDDALVLSLQTHLPARLLRHRVDVRVHLVAGVQLAVGRGHFPRVERQVVVRVDGDQHDSCGMGL